MNSTLETTPFLKTVDVQGNKVSIPPRSPSNKDEQTHQTTRSIREESVGSHAIVPPDAPHPIPLLATATATEPRVAAQETIAPMEEDQIPRSDDFLLGQPERKRKRQGIIPKRIDVLYLLLFLQKDPPKRRVKKSKKDEPVRKFPRSA